MPDQIASTVDICVIGSGAPGLALAKTLVDAGHRVAVVSGDDAGQASTSATTVLQPGALKVLDALGLRQAVEARAHRLDGYDTYVNGRRIAALRYADLSDSPAPYGLGVTGDTLRGVILEELTAGVLFELFAGSRVRSLLRGPDGRLSGVSLTAENGDPFVIECRIVVITEGHGAAAGALTGIDMQPVERGDEALTFTVPRPDGWPAVLSNHYRDDNRHLSIAASAPDRLSVRWGIRSGSMGEVRAQGFDAFRQGILQVEPRLEPVLGGMRGWEDVDHRALTGYLTDHWAADGLLLAGNAAYSLPTFGGQDLNLPLHDSVSAARVVERALREDDVSATSLREFERERRSLVANIAAFWSKGGVSGTALPSGPVSGAVGKALKRMFRSMALGPEAWQSSAAPAAAWPAGRDTGGPRPARRTVRDPAPGRDAGVPRASGLHLAWPRPPEDGGPVLADIDTYVRESALPVTGPLSGRLLWQLAKVSGTRRVFEFGSANGSSTIWLARAVGPGGKVYHSERNETSAEKARELIDRAGVADQVEILVEDTLENLQSVDGDFDLMLCDVGQELHVSMLDEVLPRLRSGGLFIADNVLLNSGRARPGGILDEMFAGESLFTTLIPLGAGLAVGVKQ
ncbi:FAD-dependent monooxygenase [Streptomyces sp. NPDC001851]|uniref:FAD-dependent monooxygenase n=1 Tax=Streptomyces sp. NPDC001851 TaxID=3154529 RepID=UPI003318485A